MKEKVNKDLEETLKWTRNKLMSVCERVDANKLNLAKAEQMRKDCSGIIRSVATSIILNKRKDL